MALHMLQMLVTGRATLSKQAWEILKAEFGETNEIQISKLSCLATKLHQMMMKSEESVWDYIKRLMELVNQLKFYGPKISDNKFIRKILHSLSSRLDEMLNILYGELGTGKILLVKAVENSTLVTFLCVVDSELFQKYLGDDPKLVGEFFRVADDLSTSIVFIDEIDAVGTKRYDAHSGEEREIQRTVLELLNQLDGFVIHTSKMTLAEDVNLEEFVLIKDEFAEMRGLVNVKNVMKYVFEIKGENVGVSSKQSQVKLNPNRFRIRDNSYVI